MNKCWRVVSVPLLLACSDSAGEPRAGFIVSDSAGIQLTHNESASSPPKQVEPSLILGEQDGPEHLQFYRISAISTDSTGSLFVVNAGDASVRVFDSAGTYVRKFGRSGEGPGEFRFPSSVHVFRDTVAVFDGRLYRTTLFNTAGDLLATWPAGDIGSGVLYPASRTSGGWIVQPWKYSGWNYEVGVFRRDTATVAFVPTLFTMRPDTLEILEIVSYPGPRRWGVQSPTAMTVSTPLFEPEPRHTVDGRGNVYVHRSAPYAIDVYDATGRHWRRITRAVAPIPVTENLINQYRDRMKIYWDTAQRRPEWEIGKAADEGRLPLPHPDALPQLGRIFASRNGTVWVERIDPDPEPVAREWTRASRTPIATRWDVFDAEGRFRHTVELPPRFSPYRAGDDWVIGVQRDDLDVERVIRYVLVQQ